MKKIRIRIWVRSNVRARARERTVEAGIGLVEAMIGLLVFTILMLVAGQLMRVHVETLLMGERQRKADADRLLALRAQHGGKRQERHSGGRCRQEPASMHDHLRLSAVCKSLGWRDHRGAGQRVSTIVTSPVAGNI